MFKEYVAEKGFNPEKIQGGINIDPISKLVLEGKFCDPNPFNVVKETTESSAEMKNFKTIEVLSLKGVRLQLLRSLRVSGAILSE